jgi:hypothetical protein
MRGKNRGVQKGELDSKLLLRNWLLQHLLSVWKIDICTAVNNNKFLLVPSTSATCFVRSDRLRELNTRYLKLKIKCTHTHIHTHTHTYIYIYIQNSWSHRFNIYAFYLWHLTNSVYMHFTFSFKYHVFNVWGWPVMAETCSMCCRD